MYPSWFELRVFFLLNWLPNQDYEPNLPCYLSLAGGRGKRWIHIFPRSIREKWIQTASSRFRTRITGSIFYNDNRNDKSTLKSVSKIFYILFKLRAFFSSWKLYLCGYNYNDKLVYVYLKNLMSMHAS